MADLTLLAGAAVFLAGMVTGRAWPSRKRKPEPVGPVCGCSHHRSVHDPQAGQCHAGIRSLMRYDERDNPVYANLPCACRQYTGPEPLPEYYAPEIAQ